jgi:hypothetical protein
MIDLRHAIPTDVLRSPRVITSAVAVVVLAVVGVTALSELGGTLLAPGVDPERADRVSPEYSRHEQMALIHRKRFEGRSLFTTPLKPPSRPKPAPVVRAEPPKPVAPPKPPGPPANYGGPRPAGVIADMLVLPGGRTVKVGETGEGITVVAIMPPDEVRLKWSGGEYTVSLRDKFDTSVLSSGSMAQPGRSNPPGITPVAADPQSDATTPPAVALGGAHRCDPAAVCTVQRSNDDSGAAGLAGPRACRARCARTLRHRGHGPRAGFEGPRVREPCTPRALRRSCREGTPRARTTTADRSSEQARLNPTTDQRTDLELP